MTVELRRHWPALLVFILLIAVVQGVGNMATMSEIPTWYAGLNKAPWNPPSWVFGPVWTILYIMIALSGWLLWSQVSGDGVQKFKAPAVRYYFIQLILNFLWSPVFFALHQTEIALSIIAALFAFVVLTMLSSKTIDKRVTYMFVPYAAWIAFAFSLNAAIVYLN